MAIKILSYFNNMLQSKLFGFIEIIFDIILNVHYQFQAMRTIMTLLVEFFSHINF